MNTLITSSSDKGDIVWEPFGGLCSASLAAHELERHAFAAEISDVFYDAAIERLTSPPRIEPEL